MLQCKEIDGLMMDWLYQELDASSSQAVEAHVGGCARCTAEVGSLRRTREVFREMSREEPPAAVSAILLHEAARRAPAVAAARGAEGGFWDRVRAWFQPLMHPAAAAVATLVLVAGVAGALYMRRGSEMSDSGRPVASGEPAPAATPKSDPAAPAGGEGAPSTITAMPAIPAQAPAAEEQAALGAAADGYAADLVDEKVQSELSRADKSAEPAKRRERSKGADMFTLKKARKPSPSKEMDREGANVANAVSGADPLVSGESGGGLRGGFGDAPKSPPPAATASTSGKSAEPADGDGFRPYRDRKPPTAAELKWLGGQETKLSSAAKALRCNEAAAIANDILDRNPDYYVERVAAKVPQKCVMAVSQEKNRRAVARNKNVGAGPSHAAPQQQKMKAAPQESDDAAAHKTAD